MRPIRRRFNLIPFAVKIPKTERDKKLSVKLRSEWPGLLAWAIQGCLEWQRIGLSPPEAVTAATAAYFEAEDALATWMREACKKGDWTSNDVLFGSWQAWAVAAGEYAGSRKRFVQPLEAHGLQPQRLKNIRGFAGIRLRFVDPSDSHGGR